MKKIIFPAYMLLLLLGGCIGDDIIFDTVPEALRIINPLDTLAVGDTYTFELLFTNNVGQEETRVATWASSDPSILEVNDAGEATGISKGFATVTATVELPDNSPLNVSRDIVVDEETVEGSGNTGQREGEIKTTSSYLLEGNFVLRKDGTDLLLEIAEDYKASTALPGPLYLFD